MSSACIVCHILCSGGNIYESSTHLSQSYHNFDCGVAFVAASLIGTVAALSVDVIPARGYHSCSVIVYRKGCTYRLCWSSYSILHLSRLTACFSPGSFATSCYNRSNQWAVKYLPLVYSASTYVHQTPSQTLKHSAVVFYNLQVPGTAGPPFTNLVRCVRYADCKAIYISGWTTLLFLSFHVAMVPRNLKI